MNCCPVTLYELTSASLGGPNSQAIAEDMEAALPI